MDLKQLKIAIKQLAEEKKIDEEERIDERFCLRQLNLFLLLLTKKDTQKTAKYIFILRFKV